MNFFIVALAVFFAGLASAAIVTPRSPPPKPVWPTQYTITGKTLLPYVEISEPFVAWFDRPNNRSRIDFYDGTVLTLQRGDLPQFGEMLKVAPMALDDGVVKKVCFGVNGTADGRVGPQNVLPDMDNFEFIDTRPCEHEVKGDCEAWGYTNYPIQNTKIDRFLLLVQRSDAGNAIPIAYEMQGYDTLFRSHYDRYILEYGILSPGAQNPDKFDVPTDLKCGDFSGPGMRRQALSPTTMNPMHAYMHNDHAHVDAAFDDFKAQHGKSYADDKEHHERRTIFLNNFRYIESINRKGLSFTLALNHLADRTKDDLKSLRGRVASSESGVKGVNYAAINTERPASWDWRIQGAVTPVKDQAICGSCWSFGTIGAIEGAYFVHTNNLTKLSEQSLMDCSWEHGNNGCDGGEEWRAYEWIIQHGGIMSEYDYGKYLGYEGRCHHDSSKVTVNFKNYVNITSNATAEGIAVLESAIVTYGPISIGIDADHPSFLFYDQGVFHDPKCRSNNTDLDHSVLAVGYGTFSSTNQRYWLVKNSWSTYWGNDGYVLMSQESNDCGVTTSPTTVTDFVDV